MSIPHTNKNALKKVPPPPIHENVTERNKATQALVRFLIEAGKKDTEIYDEVDRVIDFVNNIQNGAGLNADGTYSAESTAQYIAIATSLFNADVILDQAIWDYTREAISTVTGDASLLPESQTVLCDASSGVINITLPKPSDCFENNRSLRFAIHKIDTSTNLINILPNGTELIVGEPSQFLKREGEILNFITDRTNWYLGS